MDFFDIFVRVITCVEAVVFYAMALVWLWKKLFIGSDAEIIKTIEKANESLSDANTRLEMANESLIMANEIIKSQNDEIESLKARLAEIENEKE